MSTWDKPSAACLSSRVAYGTPITAERLKQIVSKEDPGLSFATRGQTRIFIVI